MDLEFPDTFSPQINVLLDAFDLEPGSASFFKEEGILGWPSYRYVFKDTEPGVIWISRRCRELFLSPKEAPLPYEPMTYSEALDLVFSYAKSFFPLDL